MVTYIDAVQPLAHVYDGFLVHSRGAAGAALAQSPQTPMNTPSPTFIRTDLGVPVFTFQTESDVAGGFTARQNDSDVSPNLFRQWEAAGTSHFDTYGLLIGPSDTGNGQGAVANLAAMQNPTDVPGPGGLCTQPINTGGAHWLLDSVIYWLNQWVTNGTPPPSGQPLQITSTSPFAYVKDAQRQHASEACARRRSTRRSRRSRASATRRRQDSRRIPSRRSVGSSARRCPSRQTSWRRCTRTTDSSCRPGATTSRTLVNAGFLLPADGVELQNAAGSSKIGK